MWPDAVTLELLARGAAAGVFIGLAIVVARGSPTPARVTGVLFALAAAAHTLTQYLSIGPALGPAWPLIWAFSVMGAGFFWAFARELFEDRTTLRLTSFAPAGLLLAIGISAVLAPEPAARYLWLGHELIGAALIVHALFIVAKGWRGDLVERRRRLRGPILIASAVYALAVTSVETSELFLGSAAALSPLAAAALLLLGGLALAAFARADESLFGPALPVRVETAKLAPNRLTGEDAAAAVTLDKLMREERVYREEDLTISSLALRLKLPEYRLRRLINRQLGHRSFAAFLNQWRLADAKMSLADPSQEAVPISTIALDAGFGSLGPFNRAFKAETGLTPSEFRAQALGVSQPAPSGMPKPAI
jgi:AraC-like DNA-binding protein